MGKQVVVIGLGRFGATIAREAAVIGHDVLAIDRDERAVEALKGEVAHAVRADATELEALEQLGLKSFPVGIVAIGSNQLANIMVTMHLIALGVRNVVSRANSEVHARILERLGATRVVQPERETGVRVAHTFAAPNVLEYLDLTPDHGVSKLRAPSSMIGKTLSDSRLSSQFGLTVLLLVRGLEIVVNPTSFTEIKNGDTLVVVGEDEQLEKVRSL